jgi:hypothetical protein
MDRRRRMMAVFLFLVLGGLAAAHGCATVGADAKTAGQVRLDLTGSMQGQAVGFADFDGDGLDDKLTGAPFASSQSQRGAVLVYRDNGAAGYDAQPAAVLTGDENFGYTLANLGDVDGDGKSDFAIGALNGCGAGAGEPSLSGTVSIYRGGSRGQLIRKLAGEGPMDKFGLTLAAGDLNNDGYSDIIIGAPFHTPAPSLYQQGAVYVFFGPDFKRGTALVASKASAGLGWAVAAGDINGDGIADLLLSARGKVLGFYGGRSFAPDLDAPDVTIRSSVSSFGAALAVIGDVDGGGNNSLAVGAPQATVDRQSNRGSVYIVRGGTGNRTVNLDASPADLLCRIDGAKPFDRFGATLFPVRDSDGDGKPELAAGAPMADIHPGDLSGKVYLFLGKDIGRTTVLAHARSFNGTVKNQACGTALAANGKGQLLIGGPGSDANTGRADLVDVLAASAVLGSSRGGSEAGGGGETCH